MSSFKTQMRDSDIGNAIYRKYFRKLATRANSRHALLELNAVDRKTGKVFRLIWSLEV